MNPNVKLCVSCPFFLYVHFFSSFLFSIKTGLENEAFSVDSVEHDTISKRLSAPPFKSSPSSLTSLLIRLSNTYFKSTFLSFSSFINKQIKLYQDLHQQLQSAITQYLKFEHDCQASIDLRFSIEKLIEYLAKVHTNTLN